MVSDSISSDIPSGETEDVNFSYLGNYMAFPSSSRIRTKDYNLLPRKEANENILTNYFMRVNVTGKFKGTVPGCIKKLLAEIVTLRNGSVGPANVLC